MEYEDQEEEDQEGPSIRTTSPPLEPTPLRKVRYKECLKNHAIGIGTHAVDGCGEFLPAGAEGSLESLICAACSCHRNFHRKENEPVLVSTHNFNHNQQLLLTHHPHAHTHFGYRSPSGYLHVAQPRAAAMPLALPSNSGAAGGGGSGGEMDQDYYSTHPSGSSGQKRFRTKFTTEQKEKMLELAERLGWKIQKQDEEIVQQFCSEAGLKRHVFKVWMHNNKHTVGKKIIP